MEDQSQWVRYSLVAQYFGLCTELSEAWKMPTVVPWRRSFRLLFSSYVASLKQFGINWNFINFNGGDVLNCVDFHSQELVRNLSLLSL